MSYELYLPLRASLCGIQEALQKVEQKCVISYTGIHLKPKKNPVCSGSEHKQRGKVQTRNQPDRAGREDSHLDKRRAGTIGEKSQIEQKENLKGRED